MRVRGSRKRSPFYCWEERPIKRPVKFLLASTVLLIWGCRLVSQSISIVPTATLPATETVATATRAEAVVLATRTPTASSTPEAAAIPPLLTSVPGIAPTLTAMYSTPGAGATLAAQQTTIAATVGVQLQGFAATLLKQCPNPADPPLQSWVNIPIMPQATAGQVVQTLIGSYYCFRAPVTTQDVEAFYEGRLLAPDWIMESDANGSLQFIGVSQAGAQVLFIVSGPADQNDLLIAINVTRPMMMGLPTSKP